MRFMTSKHVALLLGPGTAYPLTILGWGWRWRLITRWSARPPSCSRVPFVVQRLTSTATGIDHTGASASGLALVGGSDPLTSVANADGRCYRQLMDEHGINDCVMCGRWPPSLRDTMRKAITSIRRGWVCDACMDALLEHLQRRRTLRKGRHDRRNYRLDG